MNTNSFNRPQIGHRLSARRPWLFGRLKELCSLDFLVAVAIFLGTDNFLKID